MDIIKNYSILNSISKKDLINLSHETKEALSNFTIQEALKFLGIKDILQDSKTILLLYNLL